MSVPMVDLSTSIPLANQVAGHQNVMSDASGSLVMKPALPREIAFYHLIASAPRSTPLSHLRPYLAQFYGTLRLEGQINPSTGGVDTNVPDLKGLPESIVLENLTYPFTRPSVLDVKLGTVLHGPDASDEKRRRMEKKAANSTSSTTGLRLTGCQTWHTPSDSYILTPKSFGYSLTTDSLPSGMIRFFPLPGDVLPTLVDPVTVSDAQRASVTEENADLSRRPNAQAGPSSEPATALSTFTDHAIAPRHLARVLTIIATEVKCILDVFATLEMRFIGASLLIVYEGDPARLAQALDRYDEKRVSLAARSLADRPELDEDDESEVDDESDDDSQFLSDESESDDDDGAKADERRARRCPPLVLRLIDFAHTSLAEGEGPDKGVILGLNTLHDLIQRRLKQVNEWIEEDSRQ